MKYNQYTNKPLVCMQTNSTCYKQTRQQTPLGILWHDTGANNPTLKRYVQPSYDDDSYDYLMNLIGVNQYGNDYNHAYIESGLNAFVGQLADGTVAAVQTMPWTYRPWGCGSGKKGSCNNGWIQFEICQDNMENEEYFRACFEEACQLTAYLCDLFGFDPYGSVKTNGIVVPTILCHWDSYKLGLGTSHSDIYNWFDKYGVGMEDVRARVWEILATKDKQPSIEEQPPIEEEEQVTQEQFNSMMDTWLAEKAEEAPGDWSTNIRYWAENKGIIQGDDTGNMAYKKPINREEAITILYRAINGNGEVGDYSKEAREWAESNGIIQGDGNDMGYKRLTTREELITILYRALNSK